MRVSGPAGPAGPGSRPRSGPSQAVRTWMQRRAGRCRRPQINSPFCKPICKPDAAGQLETGETESTESTDRDGNCPVRRGHHTLERRPGTPETGGDVRRGAHNPARAANPGLRTRRAMSLSPRWVADRGTSRGTSGREIPVQSVLPVPSVAPSVQVTPRVLGSGPLVMRRRSASD